MHRFSHDFCVADQGGNDYSRPLVQEPCVRLSPRTAQASHNLNSNFRRTSPRNRSITHPRNPTHNRATLLHAMCRMILLDHLIVDPRQLSLRKLREQIPPSLKRHLDVPVLILALPDKLALKHVSKLGGTSDHAQRAHPYRRSQQDPGEVFSSA